MHYSHHNTQLRYAARINDLTRMRSEAGLLPRPFRAEMPHPIRPRQLQRPARAAR